MARLQAGLQAALLEALELPIAEARMARLARKVLRKACSAQRASPAIRRALARQLAHVRVRLVPLGLRSTHHTRSGLQVVSVTLGWST